MSDQNLANPSPTDPTRLPKADSIPLSSPTSTIIPPPTWGSRLASFLMLLVISILVLGALAVSGILPMDWLLGESHAGTTTQGERLKVELVKDKPGTLDVPVDVRKVLGMYKGGKDQVAIARARRKGLPLSFPVRPLWTQPVCCASAPVSHPPR